MRTVLTNTLYIAMLAALADVGTFVSYYITYHHPLQLDRMWRAYPVFVAVIVAVMLAFYVFRYLFQDSLSQNEE